MNGEALAWTIVSLLSDNARFMALRGQTRSQAYDKAAQEIVHTCEQVLER
jgi:hypothetical protein